MPTLEPEAEAATGRAIRDAAATLDALLRAQGIAPHVAYQALTYALARALAKVLVDDCPSIGAAAIAVDQITPTLLELTQLELRNLLDQRTPF